jgi:hypothetical protein
MTTQQPLAVQQQLAKVVVATQLVAGEEVLHMQQQAGPREEP